MTSLLSATRAGAIALVLGATALSIAPAQAASIQFGFGMGDHLFKRQFFCMEMTDSSLRAAIRSQGYSNIALNVANKHRIKARATRGDWVYQLTVHTCTGTVLDRLRLRRS